MASFRVEAGLLLDEQGNIVEITMFEGRRFQTRHRGILVPVKLVSQLDPRIYGNDVVEAAKKLMAIQPSPISQIVSTSSNQAPDPNFQFFVKLEASKYGLQYRSEDPVDFFIAKPDRSWQNPTPGLYLVTETGRISFTARGRYPRQINILYVVPVPGIDVKEYVANMFSLSSRQTNPFGWKNMMSWILLPTEGPGSVYQEEAQQLVYKISDEEYVVLFVAERRGNEVFGLPEHRKLSYGMPAAARRSWKKAFPPVVSLSLMEAGLLWPGLKTKGSPLDELHEILQ